MCGFPASGFPMNPRRRPSRAVGGRGLSRASAVKPPLGRLHVERAITWRGRFTPRERPGLSWRTRCTPMNTDETARFFTWGGSGAGDAVLWWAGLTDRNASEPGATVTAGIAAERSNLDAVGAHLAGGTADGTL